MTAEDSTLLYLFGLPAAGKNFVGGVLADEFGYAFYDGDLDLPEAMRKAVREGRPFTDEMRDEFYAAIIIRIGDLRQEYSKLAFGQATFKERHRQQIAEAYPDIIFVLIEATEEVRMERLARGNNPVTIEYAQRIASFFEPPQHPHYTIYNNFDTDFVINQLELMLVNISLTQASRRPS